MHDTIIPWVWSKKRVKSTSIIYNILNFPILDSLVGKKKLDFQNKNMSFFTLSFISTYPASFPYWNNIDFKKEEKINLVWIIFIVKCYYILFLFFQHKYHTKIDELIERTLVNMKSGLVAKLTSVLKSVLDKLSRYDEGTVFGGILSSLVCYSFLDNAPLGALSKKEWY